VVDVSVDLAKQRPSGQDFETRLSVHSDPIELFHPRLSRPPRDHGMYIHAHGRQSSAETPYIAAETADLSPRGQLIADEANTHVLLIGNRGSRVDSL